VKEIRIATEGGSVVRKQDQELVAGAHEVEKREGIGGRFEPVGDIPFSTAGHRRLPLFPGYLFMNGDAEERHRTLATNRVASVISVADQERLEEDLEQIRRLVDSEQPVDVWPGIRVGRRCCVISGPLKGLEGVVLRRRGTCRVHLAVHVLGQGAEVEIDASCLELTGENDSSVCHQMEARVQTS
jgi:transcription antitermination factor NusG